MIDRCLFKIKMAKLKYLLFWLFIIFLLFPCLNPGGGVLLGILGGGCAPGFLNPDPISDQQNNVIFHSCF